MLERVIEIAMAFKDIGAFADKAVEMAVVVVRDERFAEQERINQERWAVQEPAQPEDWAENSTTPVIVVGDENVV